VTARALTRRDCSAVDLIQDVQPPAAPSSTLSSRFRRFFDNKSTFDADHILVVNQTVAEATYDVLRRFGVDRVFGNPGSTEMRMFVRWPDDLDYVLALQEASVVAMADGFAQRSPVDPASAAVCEMGDRTRPGSGRPRCCGACPPRCDHAAVWPGPALVDVSVAALRGVGPI
jgi:hypothetical protein